MPDPREDEVFLSQAEGSPVVLNGPNEQASGAVHGVLAFTLTDGRKRQSNIHATDMDDWDAQLLSATAKIDARIARSDADNASQIDAEIAVSKTATANQVALAFLRTAMYQSDPYKAYRCFYRFNVYQAAQGWADEDVLTELSSEGLLSDDWSQMISRNAYLSDSGRVSTMTAYQSVVDGDAF